MKDSIKGGVYGTAFGDAWGKNTEFYPHWMNIKTDPEFPLNAVVTDDTQMSLYTVYAVMYELENTPDLFTDIQGSETQQNTLRTLFMDSYVEWFNDPDNTPDRAPGKTCLSTISSYQNLKKLLPKTVTMTGMEATDHNSKGCGANMRCGWLGYLPLDQEQLTNLAVLQSETTHNHPLALVSAVLTTLTVHDLAQGNLGRTGYQQYALNKIRALKDDLILKGNSAAGGFSRAYREGLPEMEEWLLSKTEDIQSYLTKPATEDISWYLGEGWVAEEAYLNALIATEAHKPGDLHHSRLKQLTQTSGDSDSVAAIGGMFIGTRDGYRDTYPIEWVQHLESRYQDELQETISFLTRVNVLETVN